MSHPGWFRWLPSRSVLEPQAELLFRADMAREARASSKLFCWLSISLMLIFNLANHLTGEDSFEQENLLRYIGAGLLSLPLLTGHLLSDKAFQSLWLYVSFALILLMIAVFFHVGIRVGHLSEGGPLIVIIVLGTLPFFLLEQKALLWGSMLLGMLSIHLMTDIGMGWTLFYCALAIGLSGFRQYRIDLLQRQHFSYELAEREKAETDKLTGALNRHAFESRLSSLLGRLKPGQSLCLGMLDIDHFKRYNDHYGHLQGDSCLVAVSRALKELPLDLLVRFGGEEFIVVTVIEGPAPDYLLHLQESISALKIPHAESPLGHVTASVGLSIYHALANSTPPTSHELLAAADALLYQAKAEGRNCLRSTRLLRPDA
jgi:diguanylate cyclase